MAERHIDPSLLEALREDVRENKYVIRYPHLGAPMTEKVYLQEFLANNPQFDDSEETFQQALPSVCRLFKEHIYVEG